MALIKDIYTREFYQFIADQFHRVDSNFDRQKFIKRIFAGNFNEMEWKQRTKHSTATLREFLPATFSEAASLLRQVVQHLIETNHPGGLEYIIFPDYIETYGIDDFETSVASFEAKWKNGPKALIRRCAGLQVKDLDPGFPGQWQFRH